MRWDENGLLHLEHGDLSCIVTQSDIHSHFREREKEEASCTRETIQTAKEHFSQVLIDTPYLLSLKLSIASGMFWSVPTRCGHAFPNQSKAGLGLKEIQEHFWNSYELIVPHDANVAGVWHCLKHSVSLNLKSNI